MYNNTK